MADSKSIPAPAADNNQIRILTESPETRRCLKCGEVKLLAEMVRDRHTKSGYTSQCKACGLARTRAWQEATRETKGIKRRVESVDPRLIRPDTSILDTDGRDWTWAFVIFREPAGFPGYLLGSDTGLWTQLGIIGLGRGKGCGSILTGKWRRKKPVNDTDGYKCLKLSINGKSYQKRLSALMLETFWGPRPEGMFACHNNGDINDNRLLNLRWDTPKENSADRERHGNTARGERGGNSKVKTDDVHEMIKLRSLGWTFLAIGRKFGICKQQSMRIIKGESWSHVHILPQED